MNILLCAKLRHEGVRHRSLLEQVMSADPNLFKVYLGPDDVRVYRFGS